MSFTLAMPQIAISGVGALEDAIELIASRGIRSVLLVTDEFLLRQNGTKKLRALLEAKKVQCHVFSDIEPNPTVHTVEAAYSSYECHRPSALIALGGGSVIDTAKAVRILSANQGPISNYEGVHHELKPGVYMVAISTTSGTAAEVTSNAVITDPVRRVKMVMISHSILPDVAVNDPSILVTMPKGITAATGMDAMTHAVEAYVSRGAHPLTDHSALEAIRIINKWLPVACDNGGDITAREMMAHGQYLAGMAFNSAGLGCVHSLAHQPGATHDLPHGVCNAILLPVVAEFNRCAAPERFARIAEAMGVDIQGMSEEQASREAIKAIRDLSAKVGIPERLGDFAISAEAIENWIEPALKDPCTSGNPRSIYEDDVRLLYMQAI